MALIKCDECNENISSEAKIYHKCGFKMKKNLKVFESIFLFLARASSLGLLFIIGINLYINLPKYNNATWGKYFEWSLMGQALLIFIVIIAVTNILLKFSTIKTDSDSLLEKMYLYTYLSVNTLVVGVVFYF